MAYTMNPFLPKLRANAVMAVRSGQSARLVARHLGVQHSTVLRWRDRAPRFGRVFAIPTRPSRPGHHPRAVDQSIIDRIIELRAERGRCAEVLHAQLLREGTLVSLSTVKRTLAREGLLKRRSSWKIAHQSGDRPDSTNAGDLVEIDSIHVWDRTRVCAYIVTLIDVWSRWAYAWALPRITAPAAVSVVGKARNASRFPFVCIQSDHGSEFSSHFTRKLLVWGIRHRHIRIRKPNDNAHVERFNRTLQDDLRSDLLRFLDNPTKLNRVLTPWLRYYNEERPHLGLNCRTPGEVVPRC